MGAASRAAHLGAPRKSGLLLSAALAGAAGLGVESVLLSCAGLALGYGRSTALGLAVWIAAWAAGAFLAGALRGSAARALLATGAASAVLCPGAALLLLFAGADAPGGVPATLLGLFAIALAAAPQGFFLPLLARAWPEAGGARDVSFLFAANLAGSVAGARLIGFDLAGAAGRVPASFAAGGCALAAGVLAAALARNAIARNAPRDASGGAVPREASGGAVAREASGGPAPPRAASRLDGRRAACIVGLGTAWLVSLEWIGLRLGVLWLGGMQPALSAVLAASLIALAAGALVLPRFLPRDAGGVRAVLALALAASVWPFVSPPFLARLEDTGPLLLALALVGPMLAPLGALLPALHRALPGESGARLGRLLLHEVWGAVIGVPLVHWVLVPRFGLGGSIAVMAALGAVGLVGLTGLTPRRALLWLAPALAPAIFAAFAREPALRSPQLDNPAFRVLAFTEDADFAVTVVDDGVRGERTLLTDSFRATGTGDDYLYMRVLGHLPLLLHPAPRRVAVLAFGTGTSAGAVSLHPEVERIDVLELSRAVCAQAEYFEEVNHGVLAGLDASHPARVALYLGDGRRTLALHPGAYDVITMEPLLPDSPFAVYLYTAEFYARARAALAEGGLLCQWVPPHALEPATFDAVVDAFARAFEWSGLFLFGTQLILIGGDAEPALDARRFPAEGAEPHVALRALGLDSAAGVLARFVATGARWPRSARPLTDADPWTVYRPRRKGVQVLADLPTNLRALRAVEADPPAAWRISADASAWQRLAGVRRLHRAREAWEVERARLFGVQLAHDPALEPVAAARVALAEAIPGDPELAAFERMVRFEEARTAGISALRQGSPETAFERLLAAASMRPERADVHLLVAAAAARLGETGVARKAAAEALALCPRILETLQGRIAVEQLGLPMALVAPASPTPGRANSKY